MATRPMCSVIPASAAKLCDGVGAPGDVEVQDLAVLLPKSQPLTEEERVEQSALGGRDDATEGLEVDLRTARRIGPDRRVVDALEEDAEVHLGVGSCGRRKNSSDPRVAVGGPTQAEVAP